MEETEVRVFRRQIIILAFTLSFILLNGLEGGVDIDYRYLFDNSGIYHAIEYQLNPDYGNDRGLICWGVSENILSLIDMYDITGDMHYLSRSKDYIDLMISSRDDKRHITTCVSKDSVAITLPVWRVLSYSSYYIGNYPKDSFFSEDSLFIRRYDNSGNRINTQYHDSCFAVSYVGHTGNILLCLLRFAEILDKYHLWNYFDIERDTFIDEIALSIDAHDNEWIDYNGNEIYGWLDNSSVDNIYWRLQYHSRGVKEEPVRVNYFALMGSALISIYELTGRDRYRYKAYHLAESFKNILGIDGNNAYYWKHKYYPSESAIHAEDMMHSRVSWRFIYDYYTSKINAEYPVFTYADMLKLCNTFTENLFLGDIEHYEWLKDISGKLYWGKVPEDGIYDMNAFVSGESWSQDPYNLYDINSGRPTAIHWIPLCGKDPRIYEIAYNICDSSQFRGIKNLLYYQDIYNPCILKSNIDTVMINEERRIELVFSNIKILGDLAVEIRQNKCLLTDTLLELDTLSDNNISAQLILDNFLIEELGDIEIRYYSNNNGIKGPITKFIIPTSIRIQKNPRMEFELDSFHITNNSYPSLISIYNITGRIVMKKQLRENEIYQLNHNLPSGFYILQLKQLGQTMTRSFLIIN